MWERPDARRRGRRQSAVEVSSTTVTTSAFLSGPGPSMNHVRRRFRSSLSAPYEPFHLPSPHQQFQPSPSCRNINQLLHNRRYLIHTLNLNYITFV